VRAGQDRPDPVWDAGAAHAVKPTTMGIFSNFRGNLFEIFWRENSCKQKISGPNAQKSIRPEGRLRPANFFDPVHRCHVPEPALAGCLTVCPNPSDLKPIRTLHF